MAKKWNDSSKQVLRPYIVKREWGKAAKAAIFMPADTCFCVTEALKQGSITVETKLLIIDRDRATLYTAYEKLVEMGFDQDNIYFFCGNLQDSSIEKFENCSGDKCNECISFIYLDTCGELTESAYRFIRELMKNKQICKECTLAFTFSSANRSESAACLQWAISCGGTIEKQYFDKDTDVQWKKEVLDNTKKFSVHKEAAFRCSMINSTLLKIIGKTHMLAIGRGYKEKGRSVPMFTARYEPKRLTHFRKYDRLVPKNLGYNN